MECSEALDFLYESFDGQLTPTQGGLLDAHRRTCFACANTLARAERFQELLLKVPQLAVPRGLEDRIIERVYAASGVTSKRTETWRSFVESFTNWRSVGLAFGTAAAALALILLSRTAIQQAAISQHQTQHSLVAAVSGILELQPAAGQASQAGPSIPIGPGDSLSSGTVEPATVAISPNLAITLSANTRIRIGAVQFDERTGDPASIAVRVDRGTLGVRENTAADSGRIHVATDQATVVPTGTVFAVGVNPGVTDVLVGEGSVAVYLPGETFNVLAGSEARISDGKHVVTKIKPSERLTH
jgi:ferric-dicitrate binding protein FerR (iron transport regulator)